MTVSYLDYRRLKAKPRWSSSIKYFPETYKFIQSLPYKELYDVRFLLLNPGGYISPHTDLPIMCLDPLSIAIYVPANCFFKFTKFGYLPVQTGKAFILNIGYEHEVLNLSHEARLNLVIFGRKRDDFFKKTM